MNDIKSYFDILSKSTIKDIGSHLTNLADLYIKPIKTWKKIISYRKSSYDFFVLIVIYYSIILFFSISNIKYVIPLAILDIVLTIFPFSFLYFPFLFYRKKFGKRIKANRLFRLLFVLKIQLNLIILVLILLYKWALIESVLVLVENFIWIIFLAFISIFPLMMRISFWRKIIWIITNYVFSLIYLILIGVILMVIPDSHLLADKFSLNTPNTEYSEFKYQYEYSDILLDDDYYLINLQRIEDNLRIRNTQFTTTRLALKLSQTQLSIIKEEKRILELMVQARKNNVPFEIPENDSIRITTKYLDSVKEKFQNKFYDDFKLVDSLSKTSAFKSNKKFFTLLHEQLAEYDSLYTATSVIEDKLTKKPEYIIESDNNNILFVTNLESKNLKSRAEQIDIQRKKFIKREEYSTLLQTIYTYPIELVSRLNVL